MNSPQVHRSSNDPLGDAAKYVCPKRKDPYSLAGKICWEVMGEFGYTDKGQFMAYKDLMLKMAIMEAMYRDED